MRCGVIPFALVVVLSIFLHSLYNDVLDIVIDQTFEVLQGQSQRERVCGKPPVF